MPNSTKQTFNRLRLWDSRSKNYRTIILELEQPEAEEVDLTQLTKPAKAFLSAAASKLSLPGHVERKALKILMDLENTTYYEGKAPSSLVASAIYIACNQTGLLKGQRVVSKACGVTEVTIRNRYPEIVEVLGMQPLNVYTEV